VLGFDAAALNRLSRSSVEAAFVDDGTRAALRSLLPA
jgi:adenosine deaminase